MGNHVWAVDFISDSTTDGRKLRFLTVLDEYTREGLAIEAGRTMGAKQVREVLVNLVRQRGAPQFVRSDNGSEFTAKLVQKALEGLGSESAFIAPGSPWQNGKNERFNGIVGKELLIRSCGAACSRPRPSPDNGLSPTTPSALMAPLA